MTVATAPLHTVRRAHGGWLVIGSIVSAQCGAGIARGLFDEMSPAVVVFFRQTITGLVLLAVARPAVRSLTRQQVVSAGLFGMVMSAMNLSFYESVARLPLALAVTIELSGPIALSLALSRRPIDAVLGLLAAGGVVLIRSQSLAGGASGAGVAFALTAGACWAVYILLNRRLGQRFDGFDGLALGMCTASLCTLPFAAIGGLGAAFHADRPPRVFAVAVLSGLVVFCCELEALRRLAARTVAVLLTLSPVAAAIVGFTWLGQHLGAIEVGGMALIVGVSVIVARSDARRGSEAVECRGEVGDEVVGRLDADAQPDQVVGYLQG